MAQNGAPLALKVYNADANSFHVDAVVVSGKSEAMVIDSGFTRADVLRIAADVLDSGKTLKTILISNADPDYYFGAVTLRSLFPQAQLLAIPAVRAKIQVNLAGKLAFWGPKMGTNAPQQPVVPDELHGNKLTLDGEAVEALQPAVVVPGHMAAGTALDSSSIAYTRNYLQRFDAESAKAKNAAELIAAMRTAYPNAGLEVALDIGAKVAKHEMNW
jgi:hypothetical protein